MRVLFIHQNIPGQFRHLIEALRADPAHAVWAIGGDAAAGRCLQMLPGLPLLTYAPPPRPEPSTVHPWLADLDAQVRRGQRVGRALEQMRARGLDFDLIVAHPAWGEALYAKDVFPRAALLAYCEFYYAAHGADVGFDPEFPPEPEMAQRLRTRNLVHLSALEACDAGLSPTRWQRDRYPALLRDRIRVIHEGIDTTTFQPAPEATFEWQGRRFRRGDPVVTFVARNLEPTRGIHVFLRALPAVLAADRHAQVIVVGGDDVSYGLPSPHPRGWRVALLEELARAGTPLDPDRVHFTGRLPYGDYRKVLQVSAVHVVLTYPFVLSWSTLEAMACGCRLVASRTAPIEEVVRDGVNGRLVDFFDRDALVAEIVAALRDPAGGQAWRDAARATVVDRFDLRTRCLPAALALLRELAD